MVFSFGSHFHKAFLLLLLLLQLHQMLQPHLLFPLIGYRKRQKSVPGCPAPTKAGRASLYSDNLLLKIV
ncbi:hypothetical protein ACB098_10G086300 [Castanea mollissima]